MLIYNLTAEQMRLYEVLKYIKDAITYAAQSITGITQAYCLFSASTYGIT